MKTLKLVLICMLLGFFSQKGYAQYKGSQYFGIGGGVVLYDNVDARMDFNEAPSAKLQLNANYGYFILDKLRVEGLFSYRQLENDVVKANTYIFRPSAIYSLYNKNKLTLAIGAGGLVGIQNLKSANDLIEIGSKKNQFIYGVVISPRFEFMLTEKTSLLINYDFEAHFNDIRRFNHIFNIGLMFQL